MSAFVGVLLYASGVAMWITLLRRAGKEKIGAFVGKLIASYLVISCGVFLVIRQIW